MPMTPYKPTVRDNTARRALELLGDTYANRKLVRNIFGSSGIGAAGQDTPLGFGVVDATPVGLGFMAQEAGRQAGQGHPWAAAANLAMALPIPAAKIAKSAARAVAGKAKGMMGQVIREAASSPSITAYHGSPHTFDQFSADKIGTGEGAQAYGHGLYFAENEGVAQSYRDTLSRKYGDFSFDGKPLKENADWYALEDKLNAAGDWRTAKLVKQFPHSGEEAPVFAKRMRDWHRNDPEMLSAIDNFEGVANVKLSPGSMYQVRINADPNDFLDWDTPLHQQPERVQTALRSAGADIRPAPKPWPVTTTASGRHTVRNGWGEVVGTYSTREKADAVASQGLAPDKYETALAYTKLGGNTAYSHLDKGGASEKLREAGIPGIKYLDQGSRGAGEGSRNFVVFDPKIIDIMKRYGVAAPVAAAILAGSVPRPAEAREQPNMFGQQR